MPDHTDTAAAPDDTLRHQLACIVDEHRLTTPVQCLCKWRETDSGSDTWAEHTTDALLPLIHDHTAAAVQQRDAALELASKNGQAAAEAYAAAMDAEAAIERVRHLHRRLPWPECHLDGESWPCRTIRELDGMEATDG